ncbi:hypothetical protein [Rhizobium sullae]|uniref:Uncharacterized protein n=1 Tax=Rhizobium sullae TaxID=50338 RepID=A0A4R3QGH2_RHISU|nr:hypothetical protein [Rhizobium sullae]TCU18802.1 hypothetical protein EV132_10229 [Rhizobium sullae]
MFTVEQIRAKLVSRILVIAQQVAMICVVELQKSGKITLLATHGDLEKSIQSIVTPDLISEQMEQGTEQ